MLLVGHFQCPQHTGDSHRATADLRGPERHRATVGLQEQRFGHGGRRRLAAIVGLHLLAIPVQDEPPTANAAGLRLDQGQHHLHGDRRIDRAAAGPQHRSPGLAGQRVGSRHHVPAGVHRLQAAAVAGLHLRGRGQQLVGPGPTAGSSQAQGSDRWRRKFHR
ncbi:hypothetical protein D3C76_1386670 [compost metagenome]